MNSTDDKVNNEASRSESKIGIENNRRLVSSLDALKSETVELFSQAKRKIQIYSPLLDPRILNNHAINQAVSQFIRSSRYAKLEILIKDQRQLQQLDHGLVRLAQKFSSNIEIKVIPKDHQDNLFAFYLIDSRQLMYRTNFERFETELIKPPHFKIKEIDKLFAEVWQQAEIASQLRNLYI
jgi:hypothetical protein